jgi:hypothetical protein
VTIRRGEEWGETVARPPALVAADDDAALARLVTADPHSDYTLTGGDLFRAVGSPAPRDPVQRLPIDALEVRLDDASPVIAVAHVVARCAGRLGWWRGPLLAVMNSDHVGEWNVAPRAHPNDGRVDVVEVAAGMSTRQRWQARSRVVSGTHLPHPAIAVRSVVDAAWTWTAPMAVRVDGVPVGRARRLTVRVVPDHFAIHV